MRTILELDLPITPQTATHQSGLRIIKTKDGRQFIGKYHKSDQYKWAQSFTAMLKTAKGDWVCQDGPVRVRLGFFFPHNKCTGTRMSRLVIPKSTKPDLDNMAKMILDCMTEAGVLVDDGKISELTLSKWHTPHHPHISIYVESLATLTQPPNV